MYFAQYSHFISSLKDTLLIYTLVWGKKQEQTACMITCMCSTASCIISCACRLLATCAWSRFQLKPGFGKWCKWLWPHCAGYKITNPSSYAFIPPFTSFHFADVEKNVFALLAMLPASLGHQIYAIRQDPKHSAFGIINLLQDALICFSFSPLLHVKCT